MTDDSKKSQSFIDPETGESNTVTFPTTVNGWTFAPDDRRAAIVWLHPENDAYYVAWEKTGGYSWSAWINVPGEIPRNTIYRSFGSPTKGLREAEKIMNLYSPERAAETDW